MRTKNAIINYIVDIIPQIIMLFISLIKVKFLLQYIGDEQLGIFQLFGQLATYLTIADAGLSGAILVYLYKPISEKNKEKVTEVFNAVKRVFNIISMIVLGAGIILSFFVTFFIKETTIATSEIQILFILFVLATSISYTKMPYIVVFEADQKRYKYNLYFQIVNIIKSLSEILLIVIFKNLISIILTLVASNILQYIIVRHLLKKNYQLESTTKKDYSFTKEIKNMIFHKLGGLIAYNIDIVIISKVIGLVEVARYSLFVGITEAIKGIVEKITTAVIPGVGNLIVTEKEKSYKTFLEYNSMLFFIAISICAPLFLCINKFVCIWYGTEYNAPIGMIVVLVLLLFYNIVRNALLSFVSAAGLFKQTRICVLLECILNLSLSLILVKYLGITGVLLATIISYVISEYLIKPSILNKTIFNDKISKYYLDNFKYIIIFILNIMIFSKIYGIFDIDSLFLWFIISLLTFILNLVVTTIEFKVINRLTFIERFINLYKERKCSK